MVLGLKKLSTKLRDALNIEIAIERMNGARRVLIMPFNIELKQTSCLNSLKSSEQLLALCLMVIFHSEVSFVLLPKL